MLIKNQVCRKILKSVFNNFAKLRLLQNIITIVNYARSKLDL